MTGKCTHVTLGNGVQVPQLGIGTWEAKNGNEVVQNIKWAINAGYRHIDTAHYYKNEKGVGQGISECGVPRSDIFVTTKLWNYDHGYESALAAFEQSRQALGVEYVDLYLIHWPGPNRSYIETWRAFEKLYEMKKVRAIGVSNFEPHHLDDLLANCTVPPMVNQVEMHPHFQQKALRAYCAEKNIAVTAWRPLGKGALLTEPQLVELAEKHKRSAAQVIIRWLIQLGVIAIPKSSHEERIKQNFDVFDFELSPEDMRRLESMDKNSRIGPSPETFFPTECK
ncbi:PGFS1 / prostaglandin f synthase [Leishmania donovani]|uniref:9,11-endoperoxide prostaglandin H2 reductase n=3 Tax=Leishmania donovani species complex TaxID=38574 RepID=A4I7L0_LEIIN|nr:putative prostaglandin f synthase [Leishmania infantum JPCM5]XP_003863465.1 prostaglandin f synthase, putative [Leishmania donovani]CAC9523226.1 prostaglandin_f_synthase_-_putative [Leishmania infantum]AYU81587.1 prostaglandin f synthase, putative [Leishmania donovani]AYU81589.1 prostaglandin f synthase, putative [Leishmania donovani]AYU81591.1 prostaglandin f synthase, putative [Leishmania donovani]AYU81593.1 prostaglandin f synthase, putative [Leishmania donovani]|eukprot:XP_001467729.1 putative prostaglandin f synthase [Leishmania infantum JPCM5]